MSKVKCGHVSMAISGKANTLTEVTGIIKQVHPRSSMVFIQLNHTSAGAPPTEAIRHTHGTPLATAGQPRCTFRLFSQDSPISWLFGTFNIFLQAKKKSINAD